MSNYDQVGGSTNDSETAPSESGTSSYGRSHRQLWQQVSIVATAAAAAALSGILAFGPDAGASVESSSQSHTLTFSFLEDCGQPPDPDIYYGAQCEMLTRNVYQGLVTYEPGSPTRKIVPALATSWTVSDQNQTYTFDLRKGVTFHDGTPFTSAAVAPSFARRIAVNGGPSYMVADVAKVETPSPYKVIIQLSAPNSSFLDELASAYAPSMLSPTGLAKFAGTDHDQTYLETHDLGTGPYELSESEPNVEYQLKAYQNYWGPKPYYTTVDFPVIDTISTEELEFSSGQIAGILHDIPASALKDYQSNSKVKVYRAPALQDEVLYVNPHKGFLQSTSARTTLFKAIDLKALVAAVFPYGGGTVAHQTIPNYMLPKQYGKENIPYDPDAFKKLVANLPSAEKNLTIGYETGTTADKELAEQVDAELDALGINATLVAYPISTVFDWVGSVSEAKTQAPNLFVVNSGPDSAAPYSMTHVQFDSTGGLQYFTCNVPGVDAIDAQANASGSDALFNKASNLSLASGCFMNLSDQDEYMAVDKSIAGVAESTVLGSYGFLWLDNLHPAS